MGKRRSYVGARVQILFIYFRDLAGYISVTTIVAIYFLLITALQSLYLFLSHPTTTLTSHTPLY